MDSWKGSWEENSRVNKFFSGWNLFLTSCFYSDGLFYLMKQYSEDSGSNSNRMSCITLIKMLRDFCILNEKVTKERVMIIYSKRCNRNLIDFGSFIDILYKISKVFDQSTPDKHERYKRFLEEQLINQISEVLGKKPYKPSISRIQVFGNEYSLENQALRLFEGYDDLLKHVLSFSIITKECLPLHE